ncbi:hypothetical protein MPSEU_001098600 [Mayamaea pseudoterrestris]|nr:hypothetical protein MPSEU_001098600 [Mayamaea pseudoterrestris]
MLQRESRQSAPLRARTLQWSATMPPTLAPTPSSTATMNDDVIMPAIANTSNTLATAADNLYVNSGYATHYGDLCEKLYAASTDGTNTTFQSLSVSFDYEMTLSTEQPAPEGETLLSYWIPALEWGTLWTTANQLGLHGCALKDDASYQQAIQPSVIVSLSSLQTDRLDFTVGATCQYLSNDSGECYPMIGSMTAKFIGDNSTASSVQEYLLSVIESQMNGDLVLTGAVKSTLYLGDRQELVTLPPTLLQTSPPTFAPSMRPTIATAAAPAPIPMIGTTTTTTSSSRSSVVLASSLSAAAAVVILGLFVVVLLATSRRGKRSDSNRKISIISEVDDQELEHIETGDSSRNSSEMCVDSPETSPLNGRSSPPSEHLIDTLADLSVMTDETVGSGEAPTVDSEGEVTVTSGGEATVVSGSSGNSDEAIGEDMDVPDNSAMADEKTALLLDLPPKPPQGPSKQPPPVQQTLSKRRRRKKKKKMKNQMMPRVGSRENMTAMETISEDQSEGVEQDSDDDDCSDSEFSYETDESGSRSRDPSPIRNDGGSGEFVAPAV